FYVSSTRSRCLEEEDLAGLAPEREPAPGGGPCLGAYAALAEVEDEVRVCLQVNHLDVVLPFRRDEPSRWSRDQRPLDPAAGAPELLTSLADEPEPGRSNQEGATPHGHDTHER